MKHDAHGCRLHIVNIERFDGLIFVETVIESHRRFRRRCDVEMRPIGDRTVCLDRSIIRRNAVDVVRFDPVLRAESRGKGEFFHRLLDEDGGAYFGEFVDFRKERGTVGSQQIWG